MLNLIEETRKEVMKYLEPLAEKSVEAFYGAVPNNWLPSDLLPDSSMMESFVEKLKEIQEAAKELPYELLAVLIGDTLTEEALPTYQSHLFSLDGMNRNSEENPWRKWTRLWTAEENRHGDVLNRYLYLCGRVNMRQVEHSTQYLIADGFEINTGDDPYRTFIYTSFQEKATQYSHKNVAVQAKKAGNDVLSKLCGMVAADEARHHKAYSSFVEEIFKVDASEMMLAFADMMKQSIVMPAHYLREAKEAQGLAFKHFSDCAQRLDVYTGQDYVGIVKELVDKWDIGNMSNLNVQAEKARDYLMAFPTRLARVVERAPRPILSHQFSWIIS